MLGDSMESTPDIAVAQHEAEDTRERILAASQKLFADKGFDATSVRDITTEAGCNVASVNYHFGAKDKLYLETFRSMLTVLRDRRIEMIGELMAREPSPSLEEFVETFAMIMLEPLVGEGRGRMFLNLVSREMIAPRLPHGVLLEEFFEPMMERVTTAPAAISVHSSAGKVRIFGSEAVISTF